MANVALETVMVAQLMMPHWWESSRHEWEPMTVVNPGTACGIGSAEWPGLAEQCKGASRWSS